MNVKTRVKAGRIVSNHNESIVRKGGTVMNVKTRVKAGKLAANHSEALVRPVSKKTRMK